jgi:hypothetical protein
MPGKLNLARALLDWFDQAFLYVPWALANGGRIIFVMRRGADQPDPQH